MSEQERPRAEPPEQPPAARVGERPSFFAELKRRHVWRVAIAYAVSAWLLLQLASIVLPTFAAPGWVLKVLIAVFVIFFPVALIIAWAFEATPAGVRRTLPADSESARSEPVKRRVGRRIDFVIIAVLVAAVGVLAWQLTVRPVESVTPAGGATRTAPAATAITAKSIAVLPFENLSDDKKNDYFVAGMQDLILTKLADIGDLKVISRTSTANYASHPDDLKTIGHQLGVATVLEGSVQKAGKQVLINVQLVDAKTDSHIWAESYTRTLDDIFGVEGEVAEKIARALDAKLSPAQSAQLAAAPTTNQAAYDLFLRAEYQTNRGDLNYDIGNWKAAIALYRQAVAKDPDFALAWARLSSTESRLANFGGGGQDVGQLNRQARADADRALQLQPDLAAARLAQGYCDYYGRKNYTAARKVFAAVLAQRPNDADALAAQGYVLRRQGHFADAIASLTQALAHDPRNGDLASEIGLSNMMIRRYPEAESWFRHAMALEPDSDTMKSMYAGAILAGSGDIPRALAAAAGDAPGLTQQRSFFLTLQRKYRDAIALLQSVPDTPDNFQPPSSSKVGQLAVLYWLAGDTAHARQLFAQALPQDRAALSHAQGIFRATAWNGVGVDELGAGRVSEGLDAIAKSEAIIAQSKDAVWNPLLTFSDAFAYAMAGRADLAVPLLAKVLTTPGGGQVYSPVLLWLDPGWDPIRHDPRFQALLKKYAQYKPAVLYEANSPARSSASRQ